MAKFEIIISCENAAFGRGQASAEIVRILRDIAKRVEERGSIGSLWRIDDINGNHVGDAWGEEPEEDEDDD